MNTISYGYTEYSFAVVTERDYLARLDLSSGGWRNAS